MNPGKSVVGTAALLALCCAIPARAQINGFGGTNWTLNNDPASQSVPTITNNILQLASSVNTANSAFYDIPQYIGSFTASFVFQNLQANDGEGFVFALQNQGTNAVSTVGANYLGYVGITSATGIAFDISPRNGIGLGYAPTQVPGGGPGGYIPTGAVDFRGTNAISVNISYANGIVQITVTDTVTLATFSTNFIENLTAAAGGTNAFVGFTGGGTAVLNLDISQFVFTPGSPTPVTSHFPVTLSTGTNTDVTQAAGNETDGAIACNPLNPAQMFIATDTSGGAGLSARHSINGGTNWILVSLSSLPAGANPAVAWDGYGNLFLAYVDGLYSGIDVAVSTNGGTGFTLLTNLATGHFTLEPKIAVGSGSALGSVWVLYKDFSVAFAPLVAQGAAVTGSNAFAAFGATQVVPGSTNDCGFGDIAVGPQGQVMVGYQDLFDSAGGAACYVSVNPGGLGPGLFQAPVVAALNAIGGNTLIPASPDGQGINAAVGLAWDSSPGSQFYGRAYLVCVGQGTGDATDTEIFLSYSTDDGASWSAQTQVDDDSSQNSKLLPRVAVDPTDGALALSWYDCRNDVGPTYNTNYPVVTTTVTNAVTNADTTNVTYTYTTNTVTNTVITTNLFGTVDSLPNNDAMFYGTVSLNGGVTFQPNVQITSDTTNGYEAKLALNPTDFGDYTGLTFYGGSFYSAWADNSGKPPNPNAPTNTLDVMVAQVTLKGLADLSITSVITNTTNFPQVGSAIYYYLTVSNAGPSAVPAASVTDVFPPEVYVVAAFPTNGSARPQPPTLHGNTLTWAPGALGVGKTATMLVLTTAVGIGTGVNQATVSPGSGITDLLQNNNSTSLPVTVYGAELNVTIAATPSQIGYGAPPVTYTITVSNQGPVSATGVLISNVLSSNLVFSGATLPVGDTYTSSPGGAVFNIGDMTNGQTVTVSLTATGALAMSYLGLGPATCTSTALGVIDPANTNNTAVGTTQIVAPDMAIGMTGAPASITVGDSVTYTVTVTNLGPVPAYGVTVADPLPGSLFFASANVPGGYTVSQNIVTANIGFLDVNQGAAFTITATALSVGQSVNAVIVSDAAPNAPQENNSAVVVTTVVSPDMAIGMTGVPGIVVAGQTVTYTINVTNLGPVRAAGVVVTNILPSNLSFVGATVPTGTTYGAATVNVAGTIAFAAKQDFATGSYPEAVALGDLTGNGKLDIVVANLDATTVSVLLNTTTTGAATASFAPKQDLATAEYEAYSVALADINGDGKPDIVVGYYGVGIFSVFLNTTPKGAATASFAARQDFSAATDTEIAVADVNGDGKPDLIISHYDSTNVSVLLNMTAVGSATAGFAPAQDFVVGNYPWIPALGDVNNGGKPAIVVPNTMDSTVSVLTNTTATGAATPSFAAQQVFKTGSEPFSVALGDLNGDGMLDLVTANYGASTVSVLQNTTAAGSGLSFASHVDLPSGLYPWFVTVADLNGDGKPDLITANTGTNTISVWMNTTAAGGVTPPTPPSAPTPTLVPSFAARQDFTVGYYPQSVAVGDINGDGKPDLVVANESSTTVSVLLNTVSNYTEQVVTFNLGSLAVGQSATLTFTATALTPGKATVTGVVGDSLIDTNPGNNSAEVTTTIVAPPPPFSNLTVISGATAVFITWNTPSNATAQVDYGLTTPNLASSLYPTLTNYHVVMLTGLVPDANYVFQVRSITAGVLATTNGTFSTASSLILGTADAGYSGPGWLTSGTAQGIFGPNFDYVVGVGGNPTASTTYAPNIPQAGLYDLSIWYPIKPGVFSSNTPIIVNGATNAVLASVDQTVSGGSWQPLVAGMYFARGLSGNLTIYNNSGDTTTSVVANGARWVYELSQDTPANGTVPAWWSDFYFGKSVSGSAHTAGNPYSNYAEYVLGLDPNSPSSQLQFLVTPGPSTNVTVTFSPFQGGRVYQLLTSSNLASPAWVTLTNTPTLNTNDGSGFFKVGPTPGAAVFYRLAVSLSPTQ